MTVIYYKDGDRYEEYPTLISLSYSGNYLVVEFFTKGNNSQTNIIPLEYIKCIKEV